MSFFVAFMITFFACFVIVPICLALFRLVFPMVIVQERQCLVYELFGTVVGRIEEPGLHFLHPIMGWQAWLVGIFGHCHVVDLRVDQHYLRSLPVNSEEGAPMGIGVWYEMYVSDPLAFLFKNTDPAGSLRANVSNATVRCLSNLSLAQMMETRHDMSRTVRGEVSPHSHEWGYKLGSVYIRKVHFRDRAMMRQIEEKVVNRLRQVTGAINQDGANQVSLIRSGADRTSAVEFARAAAIRPEVVGKALREISKDPEVAEALFEVLETERLLTGHSSITIVPKGGRGDLLTQMLVAKAPANKPQASMPSSSSSESSSLPSSIASQSPSSDAVTRTSSKNREYGQNTNSELFDW